MKSIPKPTSKVKTVFLQCISTVSDAKLKESLTDCVNLLENAELDFDDKFIAHQIYQIVQNLTILGTIGKKEMTVVYDYRMARNGMPGNIYYNQLKSAAPNGKCPLCTVRNVDTLDHYLPKSKYPSYAVTPINLIPACFQCNKGKSIDYPKTSVDQTLHPYYDNVENEVWLKANVLNTNPISFEYFVDPPDNWTQLLKDRTKNHFKAFHLNELFSSHANEELIGAKKQLMKLYNDSPNILKDHLMDAYSSRLELGINSWQAVMYLSLLNNEWFNNGGVLS